MKMNKEGLKYKFREFADIQLGKIPNKTAAKDKATHLNKEIISLGDIYIDEINKSASYSQLEKLSKVLLVSYVRDIVMLEYRNKVWNYDYMAFSRRIGEIWEPFCKLPFSYPLRALEIITPPSFEECRENIISNFDRLLDSTELNRGNRDKILRYYKEVWNVLDSGNISLSLDLHFKQDGIVYNVDYKSGFSSNEKGNTNRLLQVGCIYKLLMQNNQNMIFVRQQEKDNNHYLQTLKNSNYWDVFCATDTYKQIFAFTGFDLQKWMKENMMWGIDISKDFRNYLLDNDLFQYLNWNF